MTQGKILMLYDEYHDMVYRLALSATRSTQDAEDVVQNVFLKLLDGRHPPEPGKERPWLIKVTVNACRDLMRSGWWRKTEPLDETIPFSAPEESGLFEAVMALPPKYRVVVHLHYYEGYTCGEIARILRLSPSAVSMRLTRARNLLRSNLKEEYDEPAVPKDL